MKKILRIYNTLFLWNSFFRPRIKKSELSNRSISLNNSTNRIAKPYCINKIGTYLSDNELRILAERANNCLQNRDYDETINLYTKIIDASLSDSQFNAYYLTLRRNLFSSLKKWDLAIEDNRELIELYPDNPDNYISMGATITLKFFYSGQYRINGDNNILEKAIYYYTECLRRNPSCPSTWLNIIETYIHLQKWDDAISHYGTCRTYMNNNDDKIVHAWLGCIAIALAGEYINNEDIHPLLDKEKEINIYWDSNQIRDVFAELERIQFDKEKLQKARDIDELFKIRFKSSYI